jgi:hypothetical protein
MMRGHELFFGPPIPALSFRPALCFPPEGWLVLARGVELEMARLEIRLTGRH